MQVPVPTSKLYLRTFGFLAWLFCDPYRTFCLKERKYVFNIFLIFIKLGFSVQNICFVFCKQDNLLRKKVNKVLSASRLSGLRFIY